MKHPMFCGLLLSLFLSGGLIFAGERMQPAMPVSPMFYGRNQLRYEVSSNTNFRTVELVPGQGYEAVDDFVAIRKGDIFIEAIEEAKNRALKTGDRVLNPETISIQSVTDVTEEFEARMLFTAFSAKLSGFGAKLTASMARDRAREELRKNTVMYIIVNAMGGNSIDARDSLLNLNDPNVEARLDALEAIPDVAQRRDMFVQNFGTHYVKRVEYGFSLIIRASMASVEKESVDKLRIAISARGWGQSASAETRKTTVDTFNSLNCSFDMQVLGKVEPVGSVISTPDFENVVAIVNKIQAGEITIHETPTSYTLAPYSPIVNLMAKKYPKLAAMFIKTIPMEPADNPLPVGTLLPFAGVHVPPGFLLCDGTVYARDEYPRLFEAIGTTYGTTRDDDFMVPNFSGRTAVGAGPLSDNTGNPRFFHFGETGGENEHAITVDELPAHKHGYRDVWYSEYRNPSISFIAVPGDIGSGARMDSDNVGYQLERDDMDEMGGGRPHNNLPPYVAVNYIIKY